MSSSRETTACRTGVTIALAALTLVGCATTGSRPPEEIVRERAAKRAEAYVKSDFAAAYALLTPTYRKLRDVDGYRRSFGAGAVWQKADVTRVACEAQRCRVSLRVSVKPLIPGMFNDTITVQFEETWLLEDGNWWLHQPL